MLWLPATGLEALLGTYLGPHLHYSQPNEKRNTEGVCALEGAKPQHQKSVVAPLMAAKAQNWGPWALERGEA